MTPSRWLAAFATAVVVLHHLGTLLAVVDPGPAGGGTQWADWLDLATPYLVVAPALLALATQGSDPTGWAVAAVGSLAYAGGHGIHLAANSIGNLRGDDAPVRLWDEVVGHAIWYAGLALLVVALARSVRPRVSRAGWLLAVGVGLTWATNALGADGLVAPMLVLALGLACWGWLCRTHTAGRLLLVAYGSAAPVLVLGALLS